MTAAHQPVDPAARHLSTGHRDVRRAWLSLVLLPLSFAAAAVLGDWLLQGADSGDTSIPFPEALRTAGPAVLVLIAPAAAAVFFGLRARRAGDPAGGKAAIVGSAIAVALVALNLLALFTGQ